MLQTEEQRQKAIALLKSWQEDQSGYDEAAWAEIQMAMGCFDYEPVTDDWLRFVGFTRDDCQSEKWTMQRDDALPIGLWKVDDGWKAVLIFSEHSSVNLVRQQNTRGDVRCLCAALGINLK